MSLKSREHCWQVFKTVVYVVGYSLCCLWLFNYNWNFMWHLRWSGSVDLAQYLFYMLFVVWGVWTFGVGSIILDGMKKIGGLSE